MLRAEPPERGTGLHEVTETAPEGPAFTFLLLHGAGTGEGAPS